MPVYPIDTVSGGPARTNGISEELGLWNKKDLLRNSLWGDDRTGRGHC